jgi:hypothetical protein
MVLGEFGKKWDHNQKFDDSKRIAKHQKSVH